MQKFICAPIKIIIFMLLFCANMKTAEPSYTARHSAEIGCATLSIFSGLATNHVDTIDTKMMHHLICVTNDLLTLNNAHIDVFITQSFLINLLSIFADIKTLNDKQTTTANTKLNEQKDEQKCRSQNIDPQAEYYLTHALRIVLPIAQGAARIAAAANINNTRLNSLDREKIHGIALITQLTNLLLKTNRRPIQHLIVLLIILNSIKTYYTFSSYSETIRNEAEATHRAIWQIADNERAARVQNEHELVQVRNNLETTQRDYEKEQKIREKLHNSLLQEQKTRQKLEHDILIEQRASEYMEEKFNKELQAKDDEILEEKRQRELAESALQESIERRRHEIVGVSKNATPEEIKIAAEALLRDSAEVIE